MRMVKQELESNQCGACVVAMLTDRSRDEVIADVGDPERPDYFWLKYMAHLGFVLEDVRDGQGFDKTLRYDGTIFGGHLNLPLGERYYCSIWTPQGVHAVAIAEDGMVFDPSTSAPMIGTCTLEQYLGVNRQASGTIRVSCCYRVRRHSE